MRAWRREVLGGGEGRGAGNAQVLRIRAVVHLTVLFAVEAEVVRWEGRRQGELVVGVDAQVVVQLWKIASPRCCR